ncbi:signal recognition particle-docking protein FtsY [Infirmifilum sp. SLHALR2]|nr:MAG: signal recognition particle-docking protein FtsY [Thermofilum sp. NZ13]
MQQGLSRVFREFVRSLAYKEITPESFDEASSKLLLELVENNVALEVAEGLIAQLRERVVGRSVKRGSSVAEFIREELKAVLLDVFERAGVFNLEREVSVRKGGAEPYKVVFLGPNGHGKTTTIGKLAYRLRLRGYRVVIAAADTFRAGAIEQVSQIASMSGAFLVSLGYGADPAAVAYEAVERARKQGFDVVLVDTAGRMHTRRNLMDEMRKIIRVVEPDFRVFVGDALTGNDAVEMARTFFEEVGFDGSIVTKFDADTKGGVVLSIVYTTGRPILYVGAGQKLEDLHPFDFRNFVDSLLD